MVRKSGQISAGWAPARIGGAVGAVERDAAGPPALHGGSSALDPVVAEQFADAAGRQPSAELHVG